MSTINWDASLSAPSNQSLIPVLARFQGAASVTGYFVISATEFDGSETEVEVAPDVDVPIQPVVLPPRGHDGSLNNAILQEYMGCVYDWEFHREVNPYAGIETFIPADDGSYFNRYVNASGEIKSIYSWGNLIGMLRVGEVTVSSSSVQPPEVGEDEVVQYWRASVPFGSLGQSCAFYDMNWVDVFQSSTIGSMGQPNRIEVISNPSGGILKAMVLRQVPLYVGEGGVAFDTLRFVALTPNVPADDYVFDFKIIGAGNLSVDVELTLTVT